MRRKNEWRKCMSGSGNGSGKIVRAEKWCDRKRGGKRAESNQEKWQKAKEQVAGASWAKREWHARAQEATDRVGNGGFSAKISHA